MENLFVFLMYFEGFSTQQIWAYSTFRMEDQKKLKDNIAKMLFLFVCELIIQKI